jgi:NitT/TauT family transport system substrate-binding protein
MHTFQTRRRLLTTLAWAGAGAILVPGRVAAAEPPPETTTVRFAKIPVICFAPQYVCDALLRVEGFTDIRYVDTTPGGQPQDLARSKFDFGSNVTAQNVVMIDAGLPITLVAGVHPGCYELFAHDGIRTVRDLKGKRVGTIAATDLIEMMAAYVGLDPKKDLTIIGDVAAKPLEQFVEGKLDAYMGLPPELQELHARGFHQPIVRTAVDPPWSHYYLLHTGGQPGICSEIPRGHQAGDPRLSESRRSLRQRARAGGAAAGRWRLHRAL